MQDSQTLKEEWRNSLQGGTTPVSVQILVLNEESRLPRLLSSLVPLNPSQVIIGDTGSSDNSITICEFFGCQIHRIPWEDHFAKARNRIKSLATEDFCMWIDADEEIDPVSCQKLKRLLESNDKDKDVHFVRYSYGTSTKHQLRLWRNLPDIEWSGRVYEKIWFYDPSKSCTHDDVVIIEHPDERRPEKHRRNLALFEKELDSDPNNSYNLFHIAVLYNIVGYHDKSESYALKYLAVAPQTDIKARSYMLYLLAWTETFVKKRYQKAVNYLANALVASPCSAELWCLMGDIYWWIKRHPDALVFYENALSLGNFSPSTLWLVDLEKYDKYPRDQINKLKKMGVCHPPILSKEYGLEIPR